MLLRKKVGLLALALAGILAIGTGCSAPSTGAGGGQPEAEQAKLSGTVKIDGSSTVFPITEAVSEEFLKANPDVKVPVGVSGTGGGFKKWIAKETDINDASRKIKDQEAADAKAAGIDYKEFKIGFDGITVLVNPQNTFVDTLTVEELKKIWAPDSTVKTWKDVRAEWPTEPIKLYAPGTDSGTFDYFTETINGKSGAIRPDFTASEDDNVLVQGIAGDKNALGFFGFAYYEANKDKLKMVKVDAGNGGVAPSFDTIKEGSYKPLSRPLYLYVNSESMKRPEVKAFIAFYIQNAKEMVPAVGYIALPDEEYTKALSELQ